MALSQSALSELLDAIRAGGSVDVMREAMTFVLQELIELEASQAIGADRYERTDERTTHRNGSRGRLLSTKAGDVELRIPKFRAGSFFPALLEPRRRIDRALWAVVMEAYVHGVSTRKVDDLVAALGIDAGISKSEVSRICGELDAVVATFRDRSLGHTKFPYVFLDATYVKAHEGASVVSKAIVIATGVTASGDQEVLGLAVGDSEDGAFWTAFLRSLRARGLSGVRLVISDAHEGLKGVEERVDVSGGEADRCPVFGFEDRNHLTADEDPRQWLEDVGDLVGQAPERCVYIARREDPYSDHLGHVDKRPSSSLPTWRLRGSASSSRSRATAALGAMRPGGQEGMNEETDRRVTFGSRLSCRR